LKETERFTSYACKTHPKSRNPIILDSSDQGWEFKSGYQEKTFTHIPLHCKWTRSKQVAFTALKNLLGDDLPVSQTFVLAGLQSEETIIASPVKPDETVNEVKASVDETPWEDTPGVFRSYADRVHPEDSPGVRVKKMVEARQRYEEIIKKKSMVFAGRPTGI
jgi:hypothetical protein